MLKPLIAIGTGSIMKLLLITVVGLLTGCNAGNGENLNEQGQPFTPVMEAENTETNVQDKSTLLWIQDNVFSPFCVECHGGANPAAGQDLSNMVASANSLINVASANANFKRVLPGAAADSYLYLKITGNSQAGARMPLGRSALSDEAVNAIKQWIDLGAAVPANSNIRAQINNSRMVTTRLSTNKNAELTLNFNQPMNFSTLEGKQITVIANSTTATWTVSDENITVSIINPQTLKIQTKHLPLAVNQLNFSLNNSSISSITSIGGQQLDGNYDEVEGGEYHYEHNF